MASVLYKQFKPEFIPNSLCLFIYFFKVFDFIKYFSLNSGWRHISFISAVVTSYFMKEQSYFLQQTLLECSVTIIYICHLYTMHTISFLDSSLEYLSNYFSISSRQRLW